MNVIYLLILVSVSVAFCFLMAFLWAVKDGQYEDDYSPSVRLLFDDESLADSREGTPTARNTTIEKPIIK